MMIFVHPSMLLHSYSPTPDERAVFKALGRY
jgi:hypothetical protein